MKFVTYLINGILYPVWLLGFFNDLTADPQSNAKNLIYEWVIYFLGIGLFFGWLMYVKF